MFSLLGYTCLYVVMWWWLYIYLYCCFNYLVLYIISYMIHVHWTDKGIGNLHISVFPNTWNTWTPSDGILGNFWVYIWGLRVKILGILGRCRIYRSQQKQNGKESHAYVAYIHRKWLLGCMEWSLGYMYVNTQLRCFKDITWLDEEIFIKLFSMW